MFFGKSTHDWKAIEREGIQKRIDDFENTLQKLLNDKIANDMFISMTRYKIKELKEEKEKV